MKQVISNSRYPQQIIKIKRKIKEYKDTGLNKNVQNGQNLHIVTY
jgi:hypothetical protein